MLQIEGLNELRAALCNYERARSDYSRNPNHTTAALRAAAQALYEDAVRYYNDARVKLKVRANYDSGAVTVTIEALKK